MNTDSTREQWLAVVPIGESLLPGRPYQEAVDFGATSQWWRYVPIKLHEENVKLREQLQGRDRRDFEEEGENAIFVLTT